MEKIFLNKRLVIIAFFTVFSTASSPVIANHKCGEGLVELKLVRWIKDQPMFQLCFAGDSQNDEFTIIIRDELNSVLYQQKTVGQFFSKNFLLNTPEIGDATLKFEILNNRKNSSIVYKINRNTFQLEEIA